MINYNKKFDKNGSVSYLLEDLSRGAKTKYKGGQHYEEEIFHRFRIISFYRHYRILFSFFNITRTG